MAPRTNLKRAQIKAEKTQQRAESREAEKAKNPAPMIKDFHQLYEDGEVPRRFIGKKELEKLIKDKFLKVKKSDLYNVSSVSEKRTGGVRMCWTW